MLIEEALKEMRNGKIIQSTMFAQRKYKIENSKLYVEINGVWEPSLNKVNDFLQQTFEIVESSSNGKARA